MKEKYELNPFSPNTIFLFYGIRSGRIKALVWEGDGFLLLYKRLEAGTFKWPRKSTAGKHALNKENSIMALCTIIQNLMKSNYKFYDQKQPKNQL